MPKPSQELTLSQLVDGGTLEQWAQTADAAQVQALIRRHGVEECAALIHNLPPEKMVAVLDLDVWSRGRSGAFEGFEAEQFLCWLKALLFGGTETAVEAFVGFGIEYSAGVFDNYLEQTPMEVYAMNRAESGLGVEDKDVEHGDPLELGIYGGSYVRLRDLQGLDELVEVFLELLGGFEEHAPEFLSGVFHHMAAQEDTRTVGDDFHWDRVMRLEKAGYTPAQKAHEHLLRARKEKSLLRFSPFSSEKEGRWETPEMARLWETLRAQTGGGPPGAEASTALATAVNRDAREAALLPLVGAWMADLSPSQRLRFQKEWAWLGNLFAGGWSLNGVPMRPKSAIRCTQATVALGFNLWARQESWLESEPPTCLIDVFEMGWRFLYSNVALPAARVLDGRLKARVPGNGMVREAWFRACSRRKMFEYGMALWVRQGRYALVREILDEIEFALPPEAMALARLLLDDVARLPRAGELPRRLGKVSQKGRFIASPEDAGATLARFKASLRDDGPGSD